MAAEQRPDGRTPNRVFRLDTETWQDYEAACAAEGISRSDDLRRHIKSKVAAHKRELRRIARELGQSTDS